jgi:hypothetical protein
MFDIRKIQEQVLYGAVRNESNEETARKVVFGYDLKPCPEDNPTWVKNSMSRLEENFDRATVKKIRQNCQCGYAMEEKLQLVQEVKEASTSLEEFGNHPKAIAAGLSYSDGTVNLMFPFCPCPMVAEVDKLDTNTWCQCTTGYSKVLFERAFGCEVDVELLKSIRAGDEICLMKIIPLGKIWQ